MSNKLSIGSRGFIFFFLFALFFISCNSSPQNNTAVDPKNDHKIPAKQKPPSSFLDTMTIDFPAAVFYNLDSLQREELKAITDTMIYKSNLHDCFFQMRNSRIVLKKYYPDVKIVEVINARYLLFKMKGGERKYIDLDTKNDPCGVILFDGKKDPQLADMTNIDTELGFYFVK